MKYLHDENHDNHRLLHDSYMNLQQIVGDIFTRNYEINRVAHADSMKHVLIGATQGVIPSTPSRGICDLLSVLFI